MNHTQRRLKPDRRFAIVFAGLLKQKRKDLKLRQVDISDVLDLPRSTYAALESGNMLYMSSYRLCQLLSFFEIDHEQLKPLANHAQKDQNN